MDAVNQFLDKLLVSNASFGELVSWLASPIIVFILVLLGLGLVAPRALRLDPPGISTLIGRGRGAMVLGVVVCSIALAPPSPAWAFQESTGQLAIDVDMASREVKTGDTINFQTRVTVPDG